MCTSILAVEKTPPHPTHPTPPHPTHPTPANPTQPTPPPSDMCTSILAVEKILQYKFKNKSLLEEALTHPSCMKSRNYQRLEFLGDAVLRLAVTNYFFMKYPEVQEHQLSLLCMATLSTEKLARVAVRNELYRYFRHNATGVDDKVRDFVRMVQEEGETEVYGGAIKAPKILADIVESVAGAIYVDRGYNLVDLWMVYRRLLEPIIKVDIQPHPVILLYVLCRKQGKKVDIKNWREGNKKFSSIFVDGEFIASCFSKTKENAKLHAAKLALEKLSYQVSGSVNIELGLDGNGEGQGAKEQLHEVCGKRKWPKPSFSIDKGTGPSNRKRFVCSVEVETFDRVFVAPGNEKLKIKDAENSAASSMLCGLHEHNLI